LVGDRPINTIMAKFGDQTSGDPKLGTKLNLKNWLLICNMIWTKQVSIMVNVSCPTTMDRRAS